MKKEYLLDLSDGNNFICAVVKLRAGVFYYKRQWWASLAEAISFFE